MAVRKNGKIREVSLDTLDEKLLERDRLENVLASIATVTERVTARGELEEELIVATFDIRELVMNFGENPLKSQEMVELVNLLDPLKGGRITVDRAVAVMMDEV